MKTKKQLREERDNAEERALIHYRKLNKIEHILMIERANRTPAIIIVDKINAVIKE